MYYEYFFNPFLIPYYSNIFWFNYYYNNPWLFYYKLKEYNNLDIKGVQTPLGSSNSGVLSSKSKKIQKIKPKKQQSKQDVKTQKGTPITKPPGIPPGAINSGVLPPEPQPKKPNKMKPKPKPKPKPPYKPKPKPKPPYKPKPKPPYEPPYKPKPPYEPYKPPKPPYEQPQPPSDKSEVFTHNGKTYKCQWKYCCEPVEQYTDVTIPQCLEPDYYQAKYEIPIIQQSGVPEFKASGCDNEFGFCLSYRESEFAVYARAVYPKDVEDYIKEEIEQCLERAKIAGAIVLSGYVAEMVLLPETAPAVLPIALKETYNAAFSEFISCLKGKASINYLIETGKLKFCIYYDQNAYGDWVPLTSRHIVKMLDKIAFHSLAPWSVFVPGVGSFEDLANKLGIDTEELNKKITNTLEHWGEEGQKVLDQLNPTNWKF